MAYDNTNSGILARNQRKTEEKHPEYTGQINVNGVDYWLSAWVKERKDGSGKFFSLSVRAKDEQKTTPRHLPQQDEDSDIPF
jgi:hypothetical protein